MSFQLSFVCVCVCVLDPEAAQGALKPAATV